ncbi:hypothetical protein [Roseomonas chloroacetimidivorans]|uniref:hypothetical protein n=1 Tax=Roseomonas chloroacetimidivorans TaxID=1766656 RepID=UPI003C763FDF
MVTFVHGSGSSQLSPRNTAIAAQLRRHGLARRFSTCCCLRKRATATRPSTFPLLTDRLVQATGWLLSSEGLDTEVLALNRAATAE